MGARESNIINDGFVKCINIEDFKEENKNICDNNHRKYSGTLFPSDAFPSVGAASNILKYF